MLRKYYWATVNYTTWYHHGEVVEEDEGPVVYQIPVEQDDLAAALHDVTGLHYFDIGSTNNILIDERLATECE